HRSPGRERRDTGTTAAAAARHSRGIRRLRDPLTDLLGQVVPQSAPTSLTARGNGAARPRIVYLYLAIIVVSWAGNWPLMKLALFRLVGTLALMAPALLALRAPLLPVAGERLGLFVVGQLQVAGFIICGIMGLAIVPAGRAIVLAYTMPLWAIPFELWLGMEGL